MTARAPKKWNGSASLKNLVPVDDLTPHPRNRRRGDVERITRSLDSFGQLKPVVVNDDNTILAGHHVWQAAKALGWTHVAVAVTDLPGDEALTFLIADNRLSDLATWDDAGLLTDLGELGLDAALVAGYTPQEVEALIEKVKLDTEGLDAGDGTGSGEGDGAVSCPECGHRFKP